MVIRDRLIALIYHIVALIIGIATLAIQLNTNVPNNFWAGFGNYATIVTLFSSIIILSEIIANAIGMREKRNTIAPGVVPFLFHGALALSVSLAVIHPFYCYFVGVNYMKPDTFVYSLLSFIVFPAIVLLDWILFGEKGTVKWSYGMFPLFFPIFYFLFSVMRKNLVSGSTYSTLVFDQNTFLMSKHLPDVFSAGNGWAGVFISILSLFAIIVLVDFALILINNLFAKRYVRESNY
ncbi:MAG: hypothetical protein IKQ34_02205 [Bacilli bacterium]|nr:hypothetical protein [Bacilli bacterium]